MTSSLMPSNVDLSTMSTDLEKCLRWPAKDPVWFTPVYPGHDVQTCRPSMRQLAAPAKVLSPASSYLRGVSRVGVGDRTAWHRNPRALRELMRCAVRSSSAAPEERPGQGMIAARPDPGEPLTGPPAGGRAGVVLLDLLA